MTRVLETERERATRFLRGQFDAHPEGLVRQEVIREGRALGLSERTIQRAARDLEIVSVPNGVRPGFWRAA